MKPSGNVTFRRLNVVLTSKKGLIDHLEGLVGPGHLQFRLQPEAAQAAGFLPTAAAAGGGDGGGSQRGGMQPAAPTAAAAAAAAAAGGGSQRVGMQPQQAPQQRVQQHSPPQMQSSRQHWLVLSWRTGQWILTKWILP